MITFYSQVFWASEDQKSGRSALGLDNRLLSVPHREYLLQRGITEQVLRRRGVGVCVSGGIGACVSRGTLFQLGLKEECKGSHHFRGSGGPSNYMTHEKRGVSNLPGSEVWLEEP